MVEAKKGKRSWKPSRVLDIKDVPGYHLRWLNKDTMNLERRKAEGYLLHSEFPAGVKKALEGTVMEYRDMILAGVDEETKQARDEYYEAKTEAQTVKPADRMKQEMAQVGFNKKQTELIYEKNE